jgi:hypothetical protein
MNREKQSVNHYQRGEFFETFVISVLKQMVERHNQKLYTHFDLENRNYQNESYFDIVQSVLNSRSRPDAYAPNGIENIMSPVFIEIKYNPTSTSFSRIISDENAISLYIIGSDLQQLKQGESGLDKNVIVWDKSHIERWKDQYPIDYYGYYSNEFPSPNQIKFEDKVALNRRLLVETISRRRLSIALGAGVSRDFGAFGWDQLIDDFYKQIQKKGLVIDVDKVKKKIGGTSIINGQFAKENVKNFMRTLYYGLYGRYTPPISNYSKSTLVHVASLVKKLSNDSRFNIVSYNYDDFLEQTLSSILVNVNSVYNDSMDVDYRLTIYHPHGFLPYNRRPLWQDYEPFIVFTESEYHRLYNNPYSWPMTLQQHLYRERDFLFIGCSMTDPNLRRILEITKRDNKFHYALMLTDGLSPTDQFIVHKHFMRLGVECIWCTTISDLHNEINNLVILT